MASFIFGVSFNNIIIGSLVYTCILWYVHSISNLILSPAACTRCQIPHCHCMHAKEEDEYVRAKLHITDIDSNVFEQCSRYCFVLSHGAGERAV